jgi:DNA-binding MarR family transcriptional regulator
MLASMARSRPARGDASVDYQTLADLRYQIRRFLRIRELAARGTGVEPQQYLVLLQVKGLTGRAAATIGALAERLQIRHHAVVQLVDRLEERGMVERRRDGHDKRAVVVVLRSPGETVLRRLALHSIAELQAEAPALVRSLTRLVARSEAAGRPPGRRRTGSR